MVLIKQISYLILLTAQSSQDSYWHHVSSSYLVRWHQHLLRKEDINKLYLVFPQIVPVPKNMSFQFNIYWLCLPFVKRKDKHPSEWMGPKIRYSMNGAMSRAWY